MKQELCVWPKDCKTNHCFYSYFIHIFVNNPKSSDQNELFFHLLLLLVFFDFCNYHPVVLQPCILSLIITEYFPIHSPSSLQFLILRHQECSSSSAHQGIHHNVVGFHSLIMYHQLTATSTAKWQLQQKS